MCYTEKDMRYIDENIGRYSLEKIANDLGKSPKSLEIALIRKKGTSNTKQQNGMITAGELAKLIDIDRNTVVGWIERHGLRCHRRKTRYKKLFTFIKISDFWEWAYWNKEKINFSSIEPHSLPPEPAWVKEERKKNKKVSNYRAWTTLEEQKLLALAKKGLSYQEIALKLDRTYFSIEKKYKRLKSFYRT